MRSVFKGPYINPIYSSIIPTDEEVLFIFDKASKIPSNLLNTTCSVYNGKEFKSLFITQEMLGFRFGDFVITKKRCIYKHKKKKK